MEIFAYVVKNVILKDIVASKIFLKIIWKMFGGFKKLSYLCHCKVKGTVKT